MVRKSSIVLLVASAFVIGACASSSSDKSAESSARADSGKPWWKLSKYSRKGDFKLWVFGDVRQGKGLLGGDDDGYVLYQEKRSGSADPSKPTKVRR